MTLLAVVGNAGPASDAILLVAALVVGGVYAAIHRHDPTQSDAIKRNGWSSQGSRNDLLGHWPSVPSPDQPYAAIDDYIEGIWEGLPFQTFQLSWNSNQQLDSGAHIRNFDTLIILPTVGGIADVVVAVRGQAMPASSLPVVATGDRAFDGIYEVRSSDNATVTRLLPESTRSQLMQAEPFAWHVTRGSLIAENRGTLSVTALEGRLEVLTHVVSNAQLQTGSGTVMSTSNGEIVGRDVPATCFNCGAPFKPTRDGLCPSCGARLVVVTPLARTGNLQVRGGRLRTSDHLHTFWLRDTLAILALPLLIASVVAFITDGTDYGSCGAASCAVGLNVPQAQVLSQQRIQVVARVTVGGIAGSTVTISRGQFGLSGTYEDEPPSVGDTATVSAAGIVPPTSTPTDNPAGDGDALPEVTSADGQCPAWAPVTVRLSAEGERQVTLPPICFNGAGAELSATLTVGSLAVALGPNAQLVGAPEPLTATGPPSGGTQTIDVGPPDSWIDPLLACFLCMVATAALTLRPARDHLGELLRALGAGVAVAALSLATTGDVSASGLWAGAVAMCYLLIPLLRDAMRWCSEVPDQWVLGMWATVFTIPIGIGAAVIPGISFDGRLFGAGWALLLAIVAWWIVRSAPRRSRGVDA